MSQIYNKPLIYNNPLPLTSPVRWAWMTVTAALWVAWGTLWSPVLTIAAWLLGFSLVGSYLPFHLLLMLADVQSEINILMAAASGIILTISTWSLTHYLVFSLIKRRPTVFFTPTSADEIASYTNLPVENIAAWQNASCIVAYHNEHGKLYDVRVEACEI